MLKSLGHNLGHMCAHKLFSKARDLYLFIESGAVCLGKEYNVHFQFGQQHALPEKMPVEHQILGCKTDILAATMHAAPAIHCKRILASRSPPPGGWLALELICALKKKIK
ncbi:hypothetical protein EBR43_12625 [bacterium]|nr:hypothetical protein [bacterium]